MKLSTLLQQAIPFYTAVHGEVNVTGISMDSRKVSEGDLFVCIKGLQHDSHLYAADAEANGAVAIIAERPLASTLPVIVVDDSRTALAQLADAFFQSPTNQLHLTGVTGTNGKTTTTYLIDAIYTHAGIRTGTLGTTGLKVGDSLQALPNTTPESLTLQQAFRDMVDQQVTAGIMEVSSHALVTGRTRGCQFDVAIFTNLTQDHLDYHQTLTAYQDAKRLLFASLPAKTKTGKPTFAILNVDDKASAGFRDVTQGLVVTYGLENEADFSASQLVLKSKGTTFNLKTPDGFFAMTLPLAGKFNVYNALAAAAACFVNGIDSRTIAEGLENVPVIPGRFELVNAGQKFPVIVDYAHTPDSLKNVLDTAKELTEGRVIVVCGCGGDRDRTKRPIMAKNAVDGADYAIFTNDNPRSESPEQIFTDMTQSFKGETAFEVISDRREAITKAIHMATDSDLVLIAGKGHETYQIIGKDTFHFDDREEATMAIQTRDQNEN
ncbi:UDP-N-acetylmuramoyl-L-alanyl-D-glutamate--2,6-diaminopimelate ligase [Aureibacillus halotolerans]|uniref:UDP-N-acetylmuramoyl-L-alanyl-D-glutamate--2,6-diaminopimelate ligase n=1 Tax=Aureibacillus halotolerans TaxID=1508390 RepID=A0A4R6U974_9BACI|nr:UDP-N-acetylmuramoyl-L-alanyl-D-glutamate--2,6-diaminopimelate ligase [Aureibacillus halotolerans]TDQ42322.1 UDP-N-acetylmuramoylalanyl-D-glutamate--2,6-diaminopimelate ligase [Aureibacillus halotolerans]